jgi:hypothetical protein
VAKKKYAGRHYPTPAKAIRKPSGEGEAKYGTEQGGTKHCAETGRCDTPLVHQRRSDECYRLRIKAIEHRYQQAQQEHDALRAAHRRAIEQHIDVDDADRLPVLG